MKYESNNLVVNDPETYDDLATFLMAFNSVLFGWTDEKYTRHDILMTIKPLSLGAVERGLHEEMLFVSIFGSSAFGFDIVHRDMLYPDYVKEKLQVSGEAVELAELIDGVTKALLQ